MLDVHDERRVPLEPEPLPARDRAFQKLMRYLRRRDLNNRDEAHAKVVADNHQARKLEAASRAAQAGTAANVAARAASVLGKVGGGL